MRHPAGAAAMPQQNEMSMESRDRETEMLLDALRCALWEQEPRTELYLGADEECWRRVVAMAEVQTVTGLLADGVGRLPAAALPPRRVRMVLAGRVAAIEAGYGRTLRAAAGCAAACDAEGAGWVILKGLAAAAAYPVPEHRIQGDIDIYFADRAACDRVQRRLFGPQSCVLPDREERHYHGTLDGIEVENHFGLTHLESPRYAGLEEELGRLAMSGAHRETFGGTCLAVPSDDFNALFMLEHMAGHFPLQGFGLRHLCDWACLLYRCRDRIDGEAFRLRLERYGLGRFAEALAVVCVERLGMPAEAWPCGRLRRRPGDVRIVERVVLGGGNFGRATEGAGRHPAGILKRKLRSMLLLLRHGSRFRLVGRGLLREALAAGLRRAGGK